MSKELFVTSTPHETKLAIVEDDQLVEVYFERENEYTLAGSIYKGKVTRVLPGMQSAFVDVGLERDAFLYVTDFLEEVEDGEEFEAVSEPANRREQRQHEPRQGRDNRFAAPPPTASGLQIEGDFTGESEAAPFEGDQANESDAQPDSGSGTSEGAATSASSPTSDSGDRGSRRWRGRRGRRRGRGATFSESKFAHPDQQAVGNEESGDTNGSEDAEVFAESGQAEQASNSMLREADGRERIASGEQNDSDDSQSSPFAAPPSPPASREVPRHQPQHQQQQQRETRPPRSTRPEPVILPGESLAKFNRKPEGERTAQPSSPAAEAQPESRFQIAPRRPSTEVSEPATLLSASHGILAGESLAKYRQVKPAAEEKEAFTHSTAEQDEHVENKFEYVDQKHHGHEVQSDTAHVQEFSDVDVRPGAGHESSHVLGGEISHEHGNESESTGGDRELQEDAQQSSSGDYNFRPGAGVIEEEEVAEEESDPTASDDSQAEDEYEELEEETLDSDVEKEAEHREEKMIAAGEGLASALVQEKVQGAQYMSEEIATEEEGAEEATLRTADELEGEQPEGVAAASSDDVLDQAYGLGNVAEPDPDDPNYAGRAELRAPTGTAGYQVKTERTGFDPRRGGRKGRGRPPMRRGGGGGPRRNIPRGPMPQINELLKEGQEILVQIAKEPMAKKGARITSHIALPGRFLVFMPTVNHTGVSRKIGSEEERQRLKRVLLSEKGQGHGGFIVRTAAAGASEEDLRADIRFLINLWGEIKQRSETSKAPALIYHDLNLVERILRDQVTSTFSNIWVDSEQEYERIVRFASRFQPGLVKRVKLYSKDTPLFEQFNVQEEINKALKSKVWLKSGGYIVINQTEALVAIDINTGKYVGKTARLEDTIVKTNVDAIKEIVRQIRLRDLGGIIVIDFIDMDERKNRQKVMQALEEALKSDRSPSKVLQFNDFGLVAITRKRVKQSLERTLGTQCTYCTGTGMIKSVATVCNEIYVELRKMAKHFESQQVMLRVNPEVAKALKDNAGKWLTEMEEMLKRTIIVKSDPAQHQEQFDIN